MDQYPTSPDGTDWGIYGDTPKEQWNAMEYEAHLEDRLWNVMEYVPEIPDDYRMDLQHPKGYRGGKR